MAKRRNMLLVLFLGMLCLMAACAPEQTVEDGGNVPEYIESGDLQALQDRGYLRILMPSQQPRTLPRQGSTIEQDIELAQKLARSLDLEPELITIRNRNELIDALLAGRGDMVLARLTATPERKERILFSVPLDHVREILVVHADEQGITGPEDLAGKRVAVRRSSSFFVTLSKLAESVPEMKIVTVGEEEETETLLQAVGEGKYDATVADEDLLVEVAYYEKRIRHAFPLTGPRPIAWGIRPDSVKLKEAVDAFVHMQALTRGRLETAFGDLEEIKERKVLRVLTRNNAASYFLYRGRQMGFEFELARHFADSIDCRLQIVVPPRADQLIPWLLEGKGDLIAAAMTVTDERMEQVNFSRPYNRVSELMVVRNEADGIHAWEDLTGKTIAVRPSSSYHDTLETMHETVAFDLVEAPEHLETEELIRRVSDREYDATVADSHILEVELTYRNDVRSAFPMGNARDIAWAVRQDDAALLEAVNRFLDLEYRGEFFNVLRDKYFGNKRRIARVIRSRPDRQGSISPYDDLFRKHAREIEVDWRLLAAMAYQESRFDPAAMSWTGALGLMQIMPQTAEELGVTGDLTDPEVGVSAGARYLQWLLKRFDPSLEFEERLRFALASYNAGFGHVLDGRRLAREAGYDPDVWFENVEHTLPLLSKSIYAANSRYGYCRGAEPVKYVRQINDTYLAYTRVLD